MTTSFIALYRGETVSSAKLVAVASEPDIVRAFAARMLEEPADPEQDPVAYEIECGKRRALKVVRDGND